MKRFWDQQTKVPNYDPVGRRGGAQVKLAEVLQPRSPIRAATAAKPATFTNKDIGNPFLTSNSSSSPPPSSSLTAPVVRPSNSFSMSTVSITGTPASSGSLTRTVADLRITLDELQRERDFYFNKLREIEVATQEAIESKPDDPFVRRVNNILYAVEEGFVIPDDTACTAADIISNSITMSCAFAASK